MNAVPSPRGLPFTGHYDPRRRPRTYRGLRGRAYVAWLENPANVESFFRRVQQAIDRKAPGPYDGPAGEFRRLLEGR